MIRLHLAHHALLFAVATLLLAGCAAQPPLRKTPGDPLQRVNRAIWSFDMAFARKVALPVGHTYIRVTPRFAQTGLGHFFDNAEYPIVIVNDFLQAKLVTGLSDTGRFLLDSTVGLAGFLDPASRIGLAKNTNDFGRTLGTWGVPPGPYLVLPFLGMSDVRDALGKIPDGYLTPQNYINDTWIYLGVYGLYFLDTDARTIIPAYNLLMSQRPFDEYTFARDAYLQRRKFQIHGDSGQSQEHDEEELEKSLQESDGD